MFWVKVRLAGLNVYSGYWLAVDAPTNGIEDPLQEEGIDTLRRVMEAAGIKFTGLLESLALHSIGSVQPRCCDATHSVLSPRRYRTIELRTRTLSRCVPACRRGV